MVVAYLRVSTNKQHLENQQEEIKKFAAHRGLDIDKWYHDVVSGKVHSNDRKLGWNLCRKVIALSSRKFRD